MPYKDPEIRRQYRKRHYSANREYYLAGARKQRSSPSHAEYIGPIQRKHLLARYGITPQDYERMLIEQDYSCAICKSTTPGNGRGDRYFDVDHDHITGTVRGLLCRNCNVTVGVIEKKRALIVLIEQYLYKFNGLKQEVV